MWIQAMTRSVVGNWWRVLALISLLFLGYPLRVAMTTDPWRVESMITYVGVAAFAIGFIGLMGMLRPARLSSDSASAPISWLRRGLLLAMIILVVSLVIMVGTPWMSMFFQLGIATGVMLAAREAYPALLVLVVVIMVVGSPHDLGFIALPTGLIGLWGIATIGLTANVAELTAARRTSAELAVAEERLRFSRDLHDLLGRSLSLISVKTELGERLIDTDPARARTEIHDAHAVARRSLREVREAVSGYRQPTLAEELDGAVELLESAGIVPEIDTEVDPITVRDGVMLAWALREGVTNVVRHSQARRCLVTVTREQSLVCLTVRDDGMGPRTPGSGTAGRDATAGTAGRDATAGTTGRDATSDGGSSSGLLGLVERVRSVPGASVSTSVLDPGFELRVCIPGSDHDHDPHPGQPGRLGQRGAAVKCDPAHPRLSAQPHPETGVARAEPSTDQAPHPSAEPTMPGRRP